MIINPHTFVSQPAELPYNINYLIVGGGGAGGNYQGGGGGGGTIVENNNAPLTPGVTYTASIGLGGTSTGASQTGNQGGTTTFNGVSAVGGGGGGSGWSDYEVQPSIAVDGMSVVGGCGGGGGGDINNPHLGGTGYTNGGQSIFTGSGGGGGYSPYGAGGDGVRWNPQSGNWDPRYGGIGGDGSQTLITGEYSAYGGGGGGASDLDAVAEGGLGGGGSGAAYYSEPATSGVNGTGGGGGGGGQFTGEDFVGNGGSGVCILNIPTANYTGNTTGSPTVTTNGDRTVITFLTDGTYTA